jgi:exodeoxyribonuclease-1
LQFNHCPAIAPLGVLDEKSRQRLKLDLQQIQKHLEVLTKAQGLEDKLCQAIEILDKKQQTKLLSTEKDVDGCLYEGFFGGPDKQTMRVVRAADPSELGNLGLKFEDRRLETLLPLYKARNYPRQLTTEERQTWEKFQASKLFTGGQSSKMAKYMARLQQVAQGGDLTGHQQFLLEELKLYAESIMPDAEIG